MDYNWLFICGYGTGMVDTPGGNEPNKKGQEISGNIFDTPPTEAHFQKWLDGLFEGARSLSMDDETQKKRLRKEFELIRGIMGDRYKMMDKITMMIYKLKEASVKMGKHEEEFENISNRYDNLLTLLSIELSSAQKTIENQETLIHILFEENKMEN